MSTKAKKSRKKGPQAARVKIKGDWSEAIKKALEEEAPGGRVAGQYRSQIEVGAIG